MIVDATPDPATLISHIFSNKSSSPESSNPLSMNSCNRKMGIIVSASKVDHNNPNCLKNMVDYMATAMNNNDRLFVATFMAIYPKYATTWEVLDMVMKRYPSFQCDCKKDQKDRRAIAYFLEFWMENLPQDFCESPDLTMLNHLKTYVSLNMASSHLTACVQLLLSLLENAGHKNQSPKDKEDCGFSFPSTGSSVLQALDDLSDMQESLELRPASSEVFPKELSPEEELVEPVSLEPPVTAAATCDSSSQCEPGDTCVTGWRQGIQQQCS
uniref:ral guanine nucleotide dissociation stimulator-like n=1 Tax=Jaculus jaculus TaxID=51337 RepID=UPI001E1B5732|nr:ral guanine nucleotide dissociation stimulator-like [Jaculus jaculus]